MSAADDIRDRTEVNSVLGNRITVERRRSDGMTWTRITDRDDTQTPVVALDPDEAWALARALVGQVEPLAEAEGGEAP